MTFHNMNRIIWAVKDAIWFRQTEWGRLYIHNWVFSLFGTVTSGFCTMSAFMVSSRQFYGDPIICDSGPVCLALKLGLHTLKYLFYIPKKTYVVKVQGAKSPNKFAFVY